MKHLLLSALTTLLILIAAVPAWSEERKIVAYQVDTIPVYTLAGDSFQPTEDLQAGQLPPLPVPIIAESPRGYVLIKNNGKDMWIDAYDVEIEPKLGTGGCVKEPSMPGRKKAYSTRGLGENN